MLVVGCGNEKSGNLRAFFISWQVMEAVSYSRSSKFVPEH